MHVAYLWSRVRLAVLQRNTMKFLGGVVLNSQKKNILKMHTLKKQLKNTEDLTEALDDEEEEEFKNENIPWYMVHEDGKFMIFWQFLFALLVVINYIYAPFITAFSTLRKQYTETVNFFEITIEGFWALSIFINFVTASSERKIFNFKDSAKRYLRTYGIFDICALIGNLYIWLVLGGKANSTASIVLFIRFTHFSSMFYPIKFYIRNYTMYNKKREGQIKRIFMVFLFMIFMSHILACYLIIVGKDEGNPENNEKLWIRNNQGLWAEKADGEYVDTENNKFEIYVFSYYWVWTVITTVGYGDRSVTLNKTDVVYTLCIEFIGLIMQAVIIDVMATFVEGNYSFSALVNAKLQPLQLWIHKI